MRDLLLEMKGIEKSFPGVHALKQVDLELYHGEVLALLGENGAGKSTLMKVLVGACPADAGRILIDGTETFVRTPIAARQAGVAVIYQEFNLVPALSARENIFLGQEPSLIGFAPAAHERVRSVELLRRIGANFDPDELCRNLNIAQQQCVEIAKALAHDSKIIVMDEPSAALTPSEVRKLFETIRGLKSRGIGVIYISHRLEEIFEIADRIMVVRDGANAGVRATGEIDRAGLIEMMVGRKLDQEFPKRKHAIGRERLVVRNLLRGKAVRNVSFSVRAGEVVALAGLVGSGRTETARLIFGADRAEGGSIDLDGRRLKISEPRDAIAERIGLLTEDRKGQGLVLGLSVRENFGLPNLDRFSHFGFVRRDEERKAFAHFTDAMRIKIPHDDELARNLSGGNQQKVVLAKWLQRNCDVIIFDEPTRGIDVGAKYEIYLLMLELAAQGKAIIMISSELPEVLGMADRILVMHEGRITGEIADAAGATQAQIMDLAVA